MHQSKTPEPRAERGLGPSDSPEKLSPSLSLSSPEVSLVVKPVVLMRGMSLPGEE